MATGFTQKYIEQLPLDNLTREQFLSVAIETSKQLGWVLGNVNNSGFIAYTNNGLFSWNAEVKLKIRNASANLQSQSRGDDLIDVRENKKNLHNFVTALKGVKKRFTTEELSSKYDDLKANFT
jgi:rhomboid protease GluP